jgi:hypothetical protein
LRVIRKLDESDFTDEIYRTCAVKKYPWLILVAVLFLSDQVAFSHLFKSTSQPLS